MGEDIGEEAPTEKLTRQRPVKHKELEKVMNQLVSKMASEGAAIQPYSKHTMGPLGEEMITMWDPASTVEALMTEEAYERWVSIAPEAFEGFVPFDEPENLEGVDEEGGAQLVGKATSITHIGELEA